MASRALSPVAPAYARQGLCKSYRVGNRKQRAFDAFWCKGGENKQQAAKQAKKEMHVVVIDSFNRDQET